jgi:ribosomal protein S12 methylthiotransferase
MISLGCPKNLVDSEVMLGLAQQAGARLTRDASDAEVLVVNTCAFIDKAKQESIDTILEMAEYKKTGSCQRLVVTGCMAERYRDELRAAIPEIDAIIGTGEIPGIVAAIGAGAASRNPAHVPLLRANGEAVELKAKSALPTYLYDAETPRLMATPRHYAYVKIAEGCDYKCAFCIIPTLRGRYRSRTADSIVREAEMLAARGVKELLLISQDTTFYGIDQGERGALARLLRRLTRIDGLEWIRMLYLYPTTITDDVLDTMAESEKICNYIDLPLQHASDAVLKRMKRPGTRSGYERLLARIRARVPGVTLRTTFIVGFPGETERDFSELQQFVAAMQFDHLGVFTYSHEEGTSAYALTDEVPARVKRSRQARLMRAQKHLVSRAHARRIGTRARVLVDGPAADHELVLRARLEGQAPDIDSVVYLTECDPARIVSGTFIDAEIVSRHEYDFVARPIPRASSQQEHKSEPSPQDCSRLE